MLLQEAMHSKTIVWKKVMALVCFESGCGPIDAYNRNQAVILGNSLSQLLELEFLDLEGRIGQFHCSASYIWKKNSQSLIWNPNPEGQSKGVKRPHKRPSLSEAQTPVWGLDTLRICGFLLKRVEVHVQVKCLPKSTTAKKEDDEPSLILTVSLNSPSSCKCNHWSR